MADNEQEFRSNDPIGRVIDPAPTAAEQEEARRKLADQGQLDPEEHSEVSRKTRRTDFLNQLLGDLTGQKNSDTGEGE